MSKYKIRTQKNIQRTFEAKPTLSDRIISNYTLSTLYMEQSMYFHSFNAFTLENCAHCHNDFLSVQTYITRTRQEFIVVKHMTFSRAKLVWYSGSKHFSKWTSVCASTPWNQRKGLAWAFKQEGPPVSTSMLYTYMPNSIKCLYR